MARFHRPIPPLSESDVATLDGKTERKPGECWEWLGFKSKTGYGLTYVSGLQKNMLAHRVAYLRAKGEDPGPLDVDHTCHNRGCVNPEHLRAVTHKVNAENRAGLSDNNTSGVRGVHWDKTRGKWMARVKSHGVSKNLGRFNSLDEAERVVNAARVAAFA